MGYYTPGSYQPRGLSNEELSIVRDAAARMPGTPACIEDYTWVYRRRVGVTPVVSWLLAIADLPSIRPIIQLPYPAPGLTLIGWHVRLPLVVYDTVGLTEWDPHTGWTLHS